MPADAPSDPHPPKSRPATAAERHPSIVLARLAQAGDRRALNDLLQRYSERIHRMASVRMGFRIRLFKDSMDLVQETLLVALQNFDRLELRSESSVIQWLSKILQNQVLGAARYAAAERRDRGREVPIQSGGEDGDHESAHHPPARERLPLDCVSDQELQDIYDECLGRLQGDEREVILLRDYAGMSWERISAELGRPTERASSALYQRARIKLSEEFDRRISGMREDDQNGERSDR